MRKKRIQPAKSFGGVMLAPGDKSISHRYAILSALAEGRSEILNFSPAADCRSTLECLKKLGVGVAVEGHGVTIEGRGLEGWSTPRRRLDAGNSGTTMRLLAGALAGQPFRSEISGDKSLCQRPMKRVVDPLREMGAKIEARQDEFAPLHIEGGRLQAIEYRPKVPSAQVKSAILLAGLFAEGETVVHEAVRTRDHTELALREMGAQIERRNGTVRLAGRPRLQAKRRVVPGDISAAVYFMAAALVVPGSELVIQGVGLNPTRSAVLDFLASMGAKLSVVSLAIHDGELIGDVNVQHGVLEGGKISGAMAPRLIDELPMLAALGPYTEQGIEIRDAEELRVKESDRIAALAENLRRLGARVEELPDGLRVAGKSAGRLRGAAIDPHADHRIAMAFAVAGLGAQGETVIHEPDCVAVSFPNFFEMLEGLANLPA